jgi:hypothetical protein
VTDALALIRCPSTALGLARLWTRARDRVQLESSRLLACRPARKVSPIPLISFTFDDFPCSSLQTGGAILKAYNLRGTYYASLGLMGCPSPVGPLFSGDDLKSLLADGHELGSHTFNHRHAWKTAPCEFEASIIENQRALRELLPGVSWETLSYPIGEPHPWVKRRASYYFAGCRGGGQTYNAGVMDLNLLRAFFLEKSRDHPARVIELMERSVRAGGWLIFATHDVCEQPSRFGCTPTFFAEIVRQAAQSGAMILPVGEALKMATGSEVPASCRRRMGEGN